MATPTWRIQIVKTRGANQWSNDYLTDDVTIEDAQDLAQLLITFERHIHDVFVGFDYVRISTYAPSDRIFRHLPINQIGIPSAGDTLPLFNTVRMDMSTSQSDPARKYYRCPIAEDNQANGFLVGAYITFLNTQITTYLTTPGVLPHIVTSAGHNCEVATIHNQVQMRQLHRHKRKKIVAP